MRAKRHDTNGPKSTFALVWPWNTHTVGIAAPLGTLNPQWNSGNESQAHRCASTTSNLHFVLGRFENLLTSSLLTLPRQLSGKFGYYGAHEMLIKQDSWAGSDEARIEAECTSVNVFEPPNPNFCPCAPQLTLFLHPVDTLIPTVVFYAKSVPSDGRIHVFIFPEHLDYLVQMYYDFFQARGECPDLRDPSVVQLQSSNVNTSLLLAYETFYYPKPTSTSNEPFLVGKFSFKRSIPYSSKWSFFLTHCSVNFGGSVTATGELNFFNSYGHLDADQYPLYVFHGVGLATVLAVIAILYVALLIRRRTAHTLQLLLPVALGMAIVQIMARNAVFFYMNRRGTIAPLATLLVLCVWTGGFFAFCRIVLFLIASGFRVVYYQSSVTKLAVMTSICIIYGVMVGIQTYFEILKDPFQYLGPFVLSILMPFVNVAYFMWVSHALTQSASMAQTARSKIKIEIFERMTMLFQVCCALLLIFATCQLMKVDLTSGPLWTIWWLFEVYGYGVYLFAIVITMFIFRPRRANHLLHYSEDGDLDPNALPEQASEAPSTTPVGPIENDYPDLIAGSILVGGPRSASPNTSASAHSDPPRTKRRRRRKEGEVSLEASLEEAASRTALLMGSD